jgi:hypothetical protein
MIKNLGRIVFLAATAVLLNGCLRYHGDPVTVRAGEEQPPDFLAGPVAALLTNVDGFSARLVESTSVGGATKRTIAGELIGRQSRLIFQPTHEDRKLPKGAAAGLFFIWDGSQDRGFVLSEELQGYASIVSNLKVKSVSVTAKEAGLETIEGRPCHRVEVAVALSDGSTARFLEWQADDLKRFPIRLRSLDTPIPVTLDFSNIRLEYAPQKLFSPPEGFVQFASAVTLMNELMLRQSTLKQRPGELEPNMPITGGNNWGSSTGAATPQQTAR